MNLRNSKPYSLQQRLATSSPGVLVPTDATRLVTLALREGRKKTLTMCSCSSTPSTVSCSPDVCGRNVFLHWNSVWGAQLGGATIGDKQRGVQYWQPVENRRGGWIAYVCNLGFTFALLTLESRHEVHSSQLLLVLIDGMIFKTSSGC